MKIFIPGGGGQIGHIQCFQELPEVDEVIISDANSWAYGNFVADRAYDMPRFEDRHFWDFFNCIYEIEKFDLCLPLHDASLQLFSDRRHLLGKSPFTLALNEPDTIDLVSDKLNTYQFFLRNQIPTAKFWLLSELYERTREYPLFVKPRNIAMRGTSKQFFFKLEDEADWEYTIRKLEGRESEYVVQEYLHGTEVNLDFFCDGSGEVKSIVPLKRLEMGKTRGITRGEIIEDDRFSSYLDKITANAKFWGANQVQAFVEPDGKVKFTDINGRFSRSSVFVKEAGVNFFHYLVQLINGRPITIKEKPRKIKMTSWENHFYYKKSTLLKSADTASC